MNNSFVLNPHIRILVSISIHIYPRCLPLSSYIVHQARTFHPPTLSFSVEWQVSSQSFLIKFATTNLLINYISVVGLVFQEYQLKT
jgi:hypothetical protein